MKKIAYYRITFEDGLVFGVNLRGARFENLEDAVKAVRTEWPKFVARLLKSPESVCLYEVREVPCLSGYQWQLVRRFRQFCHVYSVLIEEHWLVLR